MTNEITAEQMWKWYLEEQCKFDMLQDGTGIACMQRVLDRIHETHAIVRKMTAHEACRMWQEYGTFDDFATRLGILIPDPKPMTYSEAVAAQKSGKKARRPCWLPGEYLNVGSRLWYQDTVATDWVVED